MTDKQFAITCIIFASSVLGGFGMIAWSIAQQPNSDFLPPGTDGGSAFSGKNGDRLDLRTGMITNSREGKCLLWNAPHLDVPSIMSMPSPFTWQFFNSKDGAICFQAVDAGAAQQVYNFSAVCFGSGTHFLEADGGTIL